jgi:hypothetical protein
MSQRLGGEARPAVPCLVAVVCKDGDGRYTCVSVQPYTEYSQERTLHGSDGAKVEQCGPENERSSCAFSIR